MGNSIIIVNNNGADILFQTGKDLDTAVLL